MTVVPDWKARVAASKFSAWPLYASGASGPPSLAQSPSRHDDTAATDASALGGQPPVVERLARVTPAEDVALAADLQQRRQMQPQAGVWYGHRQRLQTQLQRRQRLESAQRRRVAASPHTAAALAGPLVALGHIGLRTGHTFPGPTDRTLFDQPHKARPAQVRFLWHVTRQRLIKARGRIGPDHNLNGAAGHE